jgi:hypothetical protein
MVRSLETTVLPGEGDSVVPLKSDDTHDSLLPSSAFETWLSPEEIAVFVQRLC